MSQRYGGKFSQANATSGNGFRHRRVAKTYLRANLLFFAPLPLLFSGIAELRAGDAMGMIGELGALGLLLLSPWLLREGLKAEDEYALRKVAHPPAIPRKLFAAVLSGAGVLLAAWLGWGQPLFSSLAFGIIASGAHLFAFGLDPMRKKGMEGINAFDVERAAKAIEKAEQTLVEIHAAAIRFKDRMLENRVEQLAASVRDMLRIVEQDPRDLTRARKFLGVYLTGARDATIKYADLNARGQAVEARAEYVALIDDLETSFNTQREMLLLDDRDDLDIEIDVLRDRLKQEGLSAR